MQLVSRTMARQLESDIHSPCAIGTSLFDHRQARVLVDELDGPVVTSITCGESRPVDPSRGGIHVACRRQAGAVVLEREVQGRRVVGVARRRRPHLNVADAEANRESAVGGHRCHQ